MQGTIKMPENDTCAECGIELFKGEQAKYNPSRGYLCATHQEEK